MRHHTFVPALSLCAALGLTASAHADFTGQPILGTLLNGGLASGNTTGHADDNDGFDSGAHIFNIWDGGDDVFKLNWTGGDLTVALNSLGGSDNDLFIYRPTDLNSSGDYSIAGSFDEVTILAADPGLYYINIDTTAFSEGGYNLAVTPAPGSTALLGAGLLCLNRRRRR